MRRTKIICTIGPASKDINVIKELLLNGMNVARLNFSHGTFEEHGKRISDIRQASKETGVPVAIMLDTKGPEIRMGYIENGKTELKEGEQIIFTTQEILGTKERVYINYKGLPKDVKQGDTILVDDGLISLQVQKVEGTEIYCGIENGGEISDRKKLNLPEVRLNIPGLTEKDIEDIKFGVKQEVDFIAASFVRSANDVIEIRRVLEGLGADIDIISKIENRQGVKNIDEIIKASDGIMVARGDLGVEIPAEEVPLVQKSLIEKCNVYGKPVITATQMLDSMIRNPRPTRAEASDIANAIFDGTGAIMLSGETASGKYPIEAVKTMARIAVRIEQSLDWEKLMNERANSVDRTTTEAIGHATCQVAHNLKASAIITATQSGSTAKKVSKYRPGIPIIAVTPEEKVLRKLLLVWGVYPLRSEAFGSAGTLIERSIQTVLQNGYIKNGDLVVITAGVPVGIPGTTNLIQVETVSEILAKGMGIGRFPITGRVVIAETAEEALEKVKEGDILVTSSTERDFVPAIEKAGALITEEGGLTSHAAVVGLNLEIPVIVGVPEATIKLTEGETVTLDTVRGLILKGYVKVL
ncbi:MAG: pyruvate kinase [Clostridia bacterium]|nr:pyruvate kinase [Clostridia bacterium]MDD4049207.1 pyruvate kinase [Clostridia bacterium]